jgi:hypothetical protein
MSNSSISQWVPILFSGGLVGLGTFFVKQITDAKDTTIKQLQEYISSLEKLNNREIQVTKEKYDSRISSLERENKELEEELQAMKHFTSLLDKNLDELKKQGVTSETNSNIREILNILNSWRNYGETEAAHRNAGKWIRNKIDVWLNEMVEYVKDKYTQDLKDKQAEFTNDVSECLEWLYDSTYYNIPHNFSDYLPKRSIASIFPYRACFKYLKQKDDTGDLNPTETEFFYKYLNYFIEFLQEQPDF